jgi:hypothetical protein
MVDLVVAINNTSNARALDFTLAHGLWAQGAGSLPAADTGTAEAGVNSMARYGKKAQSKVKRAMHERKRGTLSSGRSGRKVKSRKQAIAIGLSEARRAGGKVPRKSTGRKKTGRKKR